MRYNVPLAPIEKLNNKNNPIKETIQITIRTQDYKTMVNSTMNIKKNIKELRSCIEGIQKLNTELLSLSTYQDEHRLGMLLLSDNKISNEKLLAILDKQYNIKKNKLGELLVEEKILTKEELAIYLKRQEELRKSKDAKQ